MWRPTMKRNHSAMEIIIQTICLLCDLRSARPFRQPETFPPSRDSKLIYWLVDTSSFAFWKRQSCCQEVRRRWCETWQCGWNGPTRWEAGHAPLESEKKTLWRKEPQDMRQWGCNYTADTLFINFNNILNYCDAQFCFVIVENWTPQFGATREVEIVFKQQIPFCYF